MLKDKLKLPASDKPGRIFPDRLGSLVMVAGLDEKGNEIERVEFGEELEAIKPGMSGFHTESDDGGEAKDEEKYENDQRIRQKRDKDAASTSVSVLKSISLDEKRSDLEYELSRREINLEKLRRIASTGIPDGGGLRATAWKEGQAQIRWRRGEIITNKMAYCVGDGTKKWWVITLGFRR